MSHGHSGASSLSRRQFLALAAAGPVALASCAPSTTAPGLSVDDATLRAKPAAPTTTIAPGVHDLASSGARAQLYVPAGYSAQTATPLIVLLHGAGRDSGEWMQAPLLPLFDAHGAIILSPDSTGPTWDRILGGFGPDVHLIDDALDSTFRCCNIDATRIALGGFSDGASYALSLGIPNGTFFSALMAFSPGFVASPGRRGLPRIFVAHGTSDQILPIDQTSRVIVPSLRQQGYTVKYEEFDGVHAIYGAVVTDALAWLSSPA